MGESRTDSWRRWLRQMALVNYHRPRTFLCRNRTQILAGRELGPLQDLVRMLL